MSNNFSVRDFQEGDEKGIIDLLRTVFPEWAKRRNAEDYWRWKYSPPLGSKITVVSNGGQIISSSHSLLLKIKLGEEAYLGQYGDDAATLPEYQGQRVYRMMEKMRHLWQDARGVKLNYSVPIHPAFNRERKEYQHLVPQLIAHHARIYDAKAYLKDKQVDQSSLAEIGLKTLNTINRIRAPTGIKSSDSIKIIEPDKFDEKVDHLWSKLSPKINLGVVKTHDYLNWRYNDRRAGDITIREAYEDDVLVGYGAAEVRGEKEQAEGYLLDIFTDNERPDVASVLSGNIITALEKRGVNSIHYKGFERHPMLSVLQRHGLHKLPSLGKTMLKISLRNLPNEKFKIIESSPSEKLVFNYGDYY